VRCGQREALVARQARAGDDQLEAQVIERSGQGVLRYQLQATLLRLCHVGVEEFAVGDDVLREAGARRAGPRSDERADGVADGARRRARSAARVKAQVLVHVVSPWCRLRQIRGEEKSGRATTRASLTPAISASSSFVRYANCCIVDIVVVGLLSSRAGRSRPRSAGWLDYWKLCSKDLWSLLRSSTRLSRPVILGGVGNVHACAVCGKKLGPLCRECQCCTGCGHSAKCPYSKKYYGLT